MNKTVEEYVSTDLSDQGSVTEESECESPVVNEPDWTPPRRRLAIFRDLEDRGMDELRNHYLS
jgi:hypothetical protein